MILFTFLFTCLLAFSSAYIVDTLHKCPIDDGPCQASQILTVIKDVSKTGIPDLQIPPLDPLQLETKQIPVPGLMDFELKGASVHGIKDCIIDSFTLGYKEGHAVINATCDVTIKGKYKFNSVGQFLQNFLGTDSLKGDGNVNIKLEKLHLKLDIFYDIIKKDNGELHFRCRNDETSYKFEIESVQFTVDKVFRGEQDISTLINGLMNENWKFMFTTFGKPFIDVGMDILTRILYNYFDFLPLKNFTDSDLSPYVKN